MSKYTDFIHNSPINQQSKFILDGVRRSYENADLVGSERSSITALHDLMLSNIDSLATRLSGATTDLMETMLGISILEFCDFNTKMGIFMNRLMQININERRITLNNLGSDAVDYGNSDNITPHALKPSYAEGMNYLDFVRKVRSSEPAGVLSTQKSPYIGSAQKTESPDKFDYGNLYPDDLSQGDDKYFRTRRWRWNEDQNSLLFKTKSLFERNKINTLISRFGTKTDGKSNSIIYNGSKKTVYGESHGRNLLKANMEVPFGGGEYMLNGYNNPYCRVWTHHYQYNQFYKTIRPFSTVEYDPNTGEEIVIDTTDDSLSRFHKWKGFEYSREKGDADKGYGWKDGGEDNNDWNKSVLSLDKGGDGILKITPKYVNSRDTNIHTKDCMFSIENLAWRGYDPYSFEKALSWEQRGPLGGRIMWFPPYGITFNETTNVNWSSNTFIGRGEDVYTYVNTVRSGTLSFLMVVDHPSVIDYISWYDDDGTGMDEYRDTDLMRFFAGCDSLDPEDPRSILSRVRPTPLTDEYLDTRVSTPPTVKENTPPPPPPKPEIPKETKKVSFYVFFPNNYSGFYDDKDFAVAYLLAGAGCQKNGEADMTTMEGSDGMMHDFTFSNLNIDFFGGSKNEKHTNPGYETTSRPVSNCILEGDDFTGEDMLKDLDEKNNFIYGFALPYSKIVKTEKKRWYYRVDGRYQTVGKDETRNTYGQKIVDQEGGLSVTPKNLNYVDEVSYWLNSDMSNWDESFRADEQEDSTDVIYCTFADIAQVVAKRKNYKNTEEFCKDRSAYGDIIANQVNTIFENYKLVNVEAVGYSNMHGINAKKVVNDTRNDNLATVRANTITQWLRQNDIIPESIGEVEPKVESGHDINETNKYDHSTVGAKMWRSCKITLIFETDETKEFAKMSQATDEEQNTTKFEKYVKYTKTDIDGQYKDMEGRTWTERTLEDGSHELVLDEVYQQLTTTDDMRGASQDLTQDMATYNAVFGGNKKGILSEEYRKYGMPRMSNKGDKNVLRYDQEYYFFRALKKKDPLVFNKLMDKIKYFDPAFHSMTPEGFNARLTFLNQCTRQGNTVTMSDMTGMTANNLAFGRPPFCVLRIGDFYNQLIVIDSVNIDYDVSNGIQWDMNTEGIGMQPLLARVNISFKFIGGSDIAGPIRRLQNAMTFNYYANTRFYDNRADRMYYDSEKNSKEVGGANHHGVDLSNPKNYAYITQQYKEVK